MRCPTCSSEMKDLFTGVFCPNDCDRPKPKGIQGTVFDVPGFTTLYSKVSMDDQLTITKFARDWRRVEVGSYQDKVVVAKGKFSRDEYYRCDWIVSVDVDARILRVMKNRFGSCDLDAIPDFIPEC